MRPEAEIGLGQTFVSKNQTDIPRDRKGRIIWSKIQDQDLRSTTIENEAQRAVDSGVFLSQKGLSVAKMNSLVHAIFLYYPGGILALKEKFEVTGIKPDDYSKTVTITGDGLPRTHKGRVLWFLLKDKPDFPQIMEEEARRLLAAGLRLTDKDLKPVGMTGFIAAAYQYYPGSMKALKENVGIKTEVKPLRYWYDQQNIEEEARKLVAQGSDLSQRSLQEARMAVLGQAVRRYPGGLQALREKLGVPQIRVPRGYWQDSANIEAEARKLVENGSDLSQRSLAKAGSSALSHAIGNNYPGKIHALREKLGLPTIKPMGYWKDPANVEKEAMIIVEKEGDLSQASVRKNNQSLGPAINKYYPDGMRALRTKLNLELSIRPVGYWTPEKIEEEARSIYEKKGQLTQSMLVRENRHDLLGAIQTKYPGRMRELRRKLGMRESSKPNGYWTPENIEKEAQAFLEQEGGLTHLRLKSKNAKALSSAISKFYPRGMRALRQKLSVEMTSIPSEYWTPAVIEQEARRIYEAAGGFSQKIMAKVRRSSLDGAIRKNYPGGINALKRSLGIEIVQRKPNRYWTPDTIEQEAREFLSQYGTLDTKAIVEKKGAGFKVIITKKYPGGFRALQEKLGIKPLQRPPNYWASAETIETEVQNFLGAGYSLTRVDFKRAGLLSLDAAIHNYYPGGISAIKEKFGISVSRRPDGYWKDIRHIEEETIRLIEAEVPITQQGLARAGMTGLIAAIYNYYPGRINALREKLGLQTNEKNSNPQISSDQANEQLAKLWEEESE